MAARANSSNTQGTTQTQAGNVTPINTWVTTFPRPAGATYTVTRAGQGNTIGDIVERDSDGGFWNSTANVNVQCDATSVGIDGMRSA